MAERPVWRGHLRLALVSCPVALYPAKSERSNLHFHFINPETGHRVRMITQDAETGEELSRRDLAKGYEFKKNHYLIMTDDDFEAARVESSTTMNIEKFVPVDAIDPIYFENSYYVVPDGDAARDVFVVLREAIRQSGRMALSRLVISRRERPIALMAMDNGLVAHTLHEQKDVHDAHHLFDQIPAGKPDAEMVQLARQLIDRQTGPFEPSDMEDRYEARLREVIEAKLRGEGIEPEPEEEEDRGNVIDLMSALKKSLQTNANSARTPEQAKAATAKASVRKAAAAKKPLPTAPAKRSKPFAKVPARKRA
ncbi:MAG TPA: Ku protein [Acetobacteraceae bacterium]|jgi:DNA end-binding protein Ku|nr:Ku protein [Acetobacteraceae bacterium]